jgi:hypothetical protein
VDPSAPVPDELSDPRAPAGPVDPVLLREAVGQVVPDGFYHDVVQVRVVIPHPVRDVWGWLDDPATFVDGQVWPFAVEFHHPPGTHAFRPGVRNDHHGPWLSLPAVVGAVRPPAHRELVYLYGAHVVSTRLLRPSRLLFDLESSPDQRRTRLTVTCEAAVRTPMLAVWRAGNRWFWPRLGRWCDASLSTRTAATG